MGRRAWWATVHRVVKSWIWLKLRSIHTHTHTHDIIELIFTICVYSCIDLFLFSFFSVLSGFNWAFCDSILPPLLPYHLYILLKFISQLLSLLFEKQHHVVSSIVPVPYDGLFPKSFQSLLQNLCHFSTFTYFIIARAWSQPLRFPPPPHSCFKQAAIF